MDWVLREILASGCVLQASYGVSPTFFSIWGFLGEIYLLVMFVQMVENGAAEDKAVLPKSCHNRRAWKHAVHIHPMPSCGPSWRCPLSWPPPPAAQIATPAEASKHAMLAMVLVK